MSRLWAFNDVGQYINPHGIESSKTGIFFRNCLVQSKKEKKLVWHLFEPDYR